MAQSLPVNRDVDFTKCGICKETITDPRALPCLHTYCLDCLREWTRHRKTDSVTCPVCKKDVALPPEGVDGLPDNFFVSSTMDRRLPSNTPPVCVCCGEKTNKLISRCVDCAGFLCQKGIEIHSTFHAMKSHQLIAIDDLKSGKIDLRKMTKPPNCSKHKDQALWLFCETCGVLICRDCTVLDHCRPDHKYVELESVIPKQKEKIKEFNQRCTVVAKQISDELKKVVDTEQELNTSTTQASFEIDQAVDKLKKHFDDFATEKKDELKKWRSQANTEIQKVKDDLENQAMRLTTAQTRAKQVLSSGTSCDVASVYSQLTTSSLEELTHCKPLDMFKQRRLGYNVQFTGVATLPGPESTIGVLRYGISGEGAVSSDGVSAEPPDGHEINSFVPVDAGVFAYILKMYGPNIRSLESRYDVKITAADVGVDKSSAVQITPVGRAGQGSIREANKAVMDLYSTVFSTLSHRVIDLEEMTISSDALGRVIADSERLYKEVLVIVSGNKLMIYGAKELDVKVVEAMVTNRVYDASRRSANSYQVRRDEGTDDLLLAKGGSSSGQGTVDYLDGSPRTQSLNRSEERSHSSAHGTEETQSERVEKSDENHIDTGQSSVALKYRLKHDKWSYKTAEGLKVRVYRGDITKEKIGAIVNAANESLLHAGGVAGAISKAAGTMMMLECSRYITKHGRLYPSQVMWTSSGNLPCQFVIHAVGPRWGEYKNKQECFETLKMTFIRCLETAEKDLMVAGIAMPIISSLGIFGVPVSQCVDALYEAISEFSRSWDPATNVLKEIRILEIEADSVKVIKGQLIGKLTGDGRRAVVRHTGNHSNHNDDARVDDDDSSSGRQQEDVGDDTSHYTEEHRRTGSAGADK